MVHAMVSNATFRTEYCFPFLIAKTTVQQRCPWPFHIYDGLKESTFSTSCPGPCHSPVTAKAAPNALSLLNSCSRRRRGEGEPGQGERERNEERWWDELEWREWTREKACFPSLWPWPGPIPASLLSFLYPLGPSKPEFPAFSCAH